MSMSEPTLASTLRFITEHPANRHHKASALLRFFGWQAWKRTVRRPITATFWRGLKIKVYPDSRSGSAALYTRLPEYDDMLFTVRLLGPGDLVVDVGANIGLYSLLAGSRVGTGRVLAFEPSSGAADRLRENARLNRLESIEVRVEAVGAAAGEAQMTQGLDTENHVVPGDEGRDRTVPVKVVALDDLVEPGQHVTLVKLDTEGFEKEVLAGSARLLNDGAVLAWIVEMWQHGDRYGSDDSAVLATFRSHGYRSYVYDSRTNDLTPADRPDIRVAWNLIMIRDLDGVRASLAAASLD